MLAKWVKSLRCEGLRNYRPRRCQGSNNENEAMRTTSSVCVYFAGIPIVDSLLFSSKKMLSIVKFLSKYIEMTRDNDYLSKSNTHLDENPFKLLKIVSVRTSSVLSPIAVSCHLWVSAARL